MMNGKYAWLIVILFLFAASSLHGQSTRYLGDGSAVVSGYGPVTIALAWGEQLKPSPNYPKVVINLKESLVKYARLQVDIRPNFRLGTDDLKKLSIVLITSDSQFELSPTEIKNLKDYIGQGGMVMVDDAGAASRNSSSGASMRKMIGELAGNDRIKPIPAAHPIYRTPYTFGGPPMGVHKTMEHMAQFSRPSIEGDNAYYLYGAFFDERLAILYSDWGYTPFWNTMESETYMKFWVNVVIYALEQRT